jgi:hypothetical protein
MSDDRYATSKEDEPAADAASLPRRRFQFSLATLLWLTTVVACLAAVWGMYRKLEASRADVKKTTLDLQAAR